MISVSEARARLPEILDRVERGDEVVISRHGRPVAVVVRPEALRARRAEAAFAGAARIRERLEAARGQRLPEGGISPERADTLVAELRAGRDVA